MGLYDINGYGVMVADETRLHAYREAMRQHIGSRTTVLDIGTGTGLHALVACQLGARHVYAIEPSDAIQVARDIARDNGFGGRITFFQEVSGNVELPVRTDLLVSDLRGVLPLFARHLPSIIDARQRLLATDGAIIPRRDTLRAAPVDAPDTYEEIVGPWETAAGGLDMSAARSLATQHVHRKRVGADALLGPPRTWGVLDYARVSGPNAAGTIDCRLERAGTMHGISAWFDAELSDGVSYSNAPGAPELVYGMAFLPLPEPVPVAAGDAVRVALAANLVGDDYVWRWSTTIAPHDDSRPTARFEQSSFQGALLSRRSLETAEAGYVPTLSTAGVIDREALRMIDGGASLRDISRRLMDRYPDAFADPADALDRVAILSRRYAK